MSTLAYFLPVLYSDLLPVLMAHQTEKETYLSSTSNDPLLDAANAISQSSPKIKAYAIQQATRTITDEADTSVLKEAILNLIQVDTLQNSTLDGLGDRVKALEALVTPPPAPVPSPSRFGGNGLLSNEQSNWWGTFTAEQNQKFSLILSGSDKSGAFKSQGVKGVIYHTLFEVGVTETSTVWPNAVTEAKAMASDWIYRDQAGNPVKDSGGNAFICDPSIPAYQAAWSASVAAQCALGAVGVFIDNCVPYAWWGTRPYKNGVAVTDQEIGDALMSLFAYFKATYPSLYLLANVGSENQAKVDFCKRAATVTDGVMIENYVANAVQQPTIQAIQAAGTDPWVITPNGVTGPSALAHQYATAFASVYDRLGGGFGLAAPEPVTANWAGPLA